MSNISLDIKRGDLFYADLSPVIGSEQGGVRPVLIIQNNIGNKYLTPNKDTKVMVKNKRIYFQRLWTFGKKYWNNSDFMI